MRMYSILCATDRNFNESVAYVGTEDVATQLGNTIVASTRKYIRTFIRTWPIKYKCVRDWWEKVGHLDGMKGDPAMSPWVPEEFYDAYKAGWDKVCQKTA